MSAPVRMGLSSRVVITSPTVPFSMGRTPAFSAGLLATTEKTIIPGICKASEIPSGALDGLLEISFDYL